MITLLLLLAALGVYITPPDCKEIKVDGNGAVECVQKAEE